MKFGYITAREIIQCADHMILSQDNVDQLILDLSVARDGQAREIERITIDYLNGYRSQYAGRVLLSFVQHQLAADKITVKQAATTLVDYLEKTQLDELFRFRNFQEFLEEAELGIYGNPTWVGVEMKALLNIFADYNFENYPQWSILHERVNAELKKYETDAGAIYYRYPPLLKPSAGLLSKLKRLITGM